MSASMEDVFPSTFQTYLAKSSGVICLKDFLSILDSNQYFSVQNSGSIQDTLSHVHNSLSSSKNRVEGLLFLQNIVQNCTTEVFQHNALTWSRLCLNILQSHCTDTVYRSACQVLGQVLVFGRTFSDITKEIVGTVIPQLLPLLLACRIETRDAAFACINTCISNYPGPMLAFKNKLDVLIIEELDNGTLSQEVYTCYALLAQCGPGGNMGLKHQEAWGSQCDKLCGSLEVTLTQLYEGLETESAFSQKGRPSLPLSSIDYDQSDRVTSLVSRWKTLTGCLTILLSEEMTTVAKLPSDRVLQLVCRCLAINSRMLLSRATSERSLLASCISDIHMCGLEVLQQLITLCRSLLLPQCVVISSLFSQELLWTYTENCGHNVMFGCLREKVYTVMTHWIQTLTCNTGIVTEEKVLVKQILQDCTPYVESIKLTSTGRKEEGVSKKKKRKGYQEISQGISSQRKVQPYANSGLVTAGLEALYWMVLTVGPEMDRKLVQEIQSFVIKTCLTLQQTNEVPVPYSHSPCRRGLYRVLQACVVTPHPQVPPPTQCCLQLFAIGQRDRSLEVSSFCLEAMRICETLIHPRVPCLNGPIVCEHLVKIGGVTEKLANGNIGHNSNVVENIGQKRSLENETNDDFVARKVVKDQEGIDVRSKSDFGVTVVDSKKEINESMETSETNNYENDETSSKNEDNSIVIDDDDEDDDDENDDEGNDNDVVAELKTTNDKKEDIETVVFLSNSKSKNNEPTASTSTSDDIEDNTGGPNKENKVLEVSSDEASNGEPIVIPSDEVEQSGQKADNPEVESMLMTFIDADPDSD